MLASASADQTLRLWDVKRGAELKRFQGHEDEVYAIAWTPGGRQLVSGGKDDSVRFWDLQAEVQESAYIVVPAELRGIKVHPG